MSKLTPHEIMSLIHDGNTSDFNECSDDEISYNVNEFEVDAINWDELDVLQRELEIADNSNVQDLSMLVNENSIDEENNQVPHIINSSIQNKFTSDFAWGSNLKFSNKSKFIRKSTNDFNQYQRTEWTPLDYFKHFIPDQIMENFSFHTNSRYVEQRGKSLKTTPIEIKNFFGISIFMSSMGYPQIRMYWTKGTRVPLVSNNMARDRYFLIRSNLKIVNDFSISDEIKKKDFLWKIRPILDSVRNGCLQLIRDTHLSIDEQIIPFTGSTRLKQYVKGKPNPEGLKNFVLADRNGLVLDFFIYQGKKTTIDHDDCEFSLTLAESVVWHLSETVPPKTCLYFDRYFTTEKLVQILLKKKNFSTGTVMKNHLPKNITLMSDKAMMKSNRGTSKQYVREDKKMVLVKWFDNKPIHLLSSESGKEPKDTCRRW